jgi:N,N'-diacetyllegionaminate synthase
MSDVFIIAEAGVNHNGSIELAMRLVEAAREAGADAVKFQSFHADQLVSAEAPKAAYQQQAASKTETQREMLKRLELSDEAHRQILARCQELGIQFLSTPFDPERLRFLLSLGMGLLKIPSGEITNLPFLMEAAATGKRIILSTGMSHLHEVGEALDALVRGGARMQDITVLHCTSQYPTPYEDVNLRAMLTIRDRFGVAVGYSDHTPGTEVAVAAAALGATVIEKHFTLDRTLEGPDHGASLTPDELAEMVRAIRRVSTALGNGIKRPMPSETENIAVARKSIVAARSIRKGEPFTAENLDVRRPGSGISPMKWFTILAMTAKRDFNQGEEIEL